MQTKVNQLDLLNEIIYDNLAGILKKLNKRIHVKLYALVYDKEQNLVEAIRVKKTVVKLENPLSISQDVLQKITNVYAELKIEPTHERNTYDDIKEYVNRTWYNQYPPQTDISNDEKSTMPLPGIEEVHTVNEKSHINETRILYANQIPFQADNSTFSVVYIIEIRNVEHETRQLFYTKPEISFLRMLLDYFFSDFFALTDNHVKMNTDDTITRKYNEDGIQFNRRLTRLFFGKMQNYLLNNTTFDIFGADFEHELHNQYYVNSLLEKMDDISALTYENASPFGSILFMNKDVIAQQSIIRFTVKFTLEDRIRLEDAKRIRKLLELTNVDKDLCLISDEKEIYGLGEVNWNVQKGALALRLDFTGLSKYNLVLVRTETESSSGGELLVEDERKFYRSDLSLIETNLVSVTFKNPRFGEEGYSSEKFTNLLKNTFWENQEDHAQIMHKMQRLDQIVRKAREQKQGTMVVITEPLTAKQEMRQLSKQSTLIEPGIINPEYIKFLTAIDGAIYFDSDGNCHAIGVILDGIAKEDIGDSSRGARYNSAHRYLHKLRDDEQKKCVIVIISEDGMVDLIPELEHEDMLLAVAEEIIDMINEENPDADKLKEKEDILLQSKIVDCDWLFNIAEVYNDNDNVERAIDFYEYGFERAEKSYIPTKYYNLLGNCYHYQKSYIVAIEMYELAIKGSDNERSKIVYLRNAGRSCFLLALQLNDNAEKFKEVIDWLSQSFELARTHSLKNLAIDYNTRGRCYWQLSTLEKSQEKKTQFLEASIEDYSRAITIEPEDNVYYWNRSLTYSRLGQPKSSIEDLIQAEYIKHDDKYINKLTQLFKKHLGLVSESFEFYEKLVGKKKGSPQLMEFFSVHIAKAEVNKQDEVAADKADGIDEN
ncbi:tetratricopeptide repeat protein [Lysinibacillus parviboronicapiens]|uniref:tetratricopeptide repeat protein n=1 Tax=Lysinibacillus parviboronicapiens TaxID=436516 RepID=UPI000D357528|nr:tetratricopeptide repeat protein [Lysinibacillus parviboronicapiens]